MLELQTKLNKLQSEVAEKDDHIRRLRTEAETAQKLDEEVRRAQNAEEQEQMGRMKAEAKERETPDSKSHDGNRRNARTTSATRQGA